MSSAGEPIAVFAEAALEWAAGGRGQPLVDAAAAALALGVDSPTLRVLAGAPRASADEESSELAQRVFEELGLRIPARLSSEAILEGGRQRAARFLERGGSPRVLAEDLMHVWRASGFPSSLAVWSGIEDWYDMIDRRTISTDPGEVDNAVIEAARAFVEGRTPQPMGPFAGQTRGARPKVRTRRDRRVLSVAVFVIIVTVWSVVVAQQSYVVALCSALTVIGVTIGFGGLFKINDDPRPGSIHRRRRP